MLKDTGRMLLALVGAIAIIFSIIKIHPRFLQSVLPVDCVESPDHHKRTLLQPNSKRTLLQPTSTGIHQANKDQNIIVDILPSGWDTAGQTLWANARSGLINLLIDDAEGTVTYQAPPMGPVRAHYDRREAVHGGAWLKKKLDGKITWETQTFKTFLTHGPGHDVYVDFGSWIGPTLFFSAQMFKRSFAIEADPVAFASVFTTLHLNHEKHWFDSITLQPGGVGLGSEYTIDPVPIDMKSGKAGNSCSGMGDAVNCGNVTDRWKVNTYRLPGLLKYWEVEEHKAFIKVDTESFECALIPSWLPWLQGLEGKKPTFYITFHSYIVDCTAEQYADIVTFSKLFRTVSHMSKGRSEVLEITNSFQAYKASELLFTDKGISP